MNGLKVSHRLSLLRFVRSLSNWMHAMFAAAPAVGDSQLAGLLNQGANAMNVHHSVHQKILPGLLEVCESIHPDCSVVLIGSVAAGTQRVDSDLDLTLIFPGDEQPVKEHPYIGDDNRWQLVVKDVVEGIRVDIAWETQNVLMEYVSGPQVQTCWPISRGRILRDPQQLAAPAIAIARQWYIDHPEVRQQYEQDYAAAKRRQAEARR